VKKDLKQKIKTDEFRTGLEIAVDWAAQHREGLKIGLVVGAVALAAAGGVAYARAHREAEAERAFSEALESFRVPLAAEQPEGAERPPGPVFATAEEKYTKALGGFEGVDRRYGRTSQGLRARYYAALCRVELGQTAEAEKGLREIAARKEPGTLEPALARLALADLLRRSGRTDLAVDAYKQILDDPTTPLPRDHALMSLAGALEEARRLAESRAAYRRLVEEHPDSVYASEARARAERLETAAEGS
jgi:tetratricopeptide (TPR) repeat protein